MAPQRIVAALWTCDMQAQWRLCQTNAQRSFSAIKGCVVKLLIDNREYCVDNFYGHLWVGNGTNPPGATVAVFCLRGWSECHKQRNISLMFLRYPRPLRTTPLAASRRIPCLAWSAWWVSGTAAAEPQHNLEEARETQDSIRSKKGRGVARWGFDYGKTRQKKRSKSREVI